jgi:SpoVK/Ycf46/Vps4 family AAA+-type ATPase
LEGVLTISNRKGRAVSSQEVPEVTWAEIKGNIDSLVGLAEVKEQLFQIARTLYKR